MGKALGRAERLRVEADLVEAEEALSAAKPERKVCDTCGQKIPWTAAQRKKVKDAAAKARKLRRSFREDRARQ